MIESDLALDIRKHFGIRCVLDIRVCPHQFDETVKAGAALGVHFHELHQLADRRDKGGDIEREGEQVNEIQLPAHDQQPTGRDHRHLHDADRGFDAGVEKPHRAIVSDLA